MRLHRSLALALGLVMLVAAGTSSSAGAEEEKVRNRVAFSVERTREVENDRVTAVLGVTDEDEDPARLADRMNKAMGWALEKARAASDVEVRSGAYRTHAITDKARLRRWRASQDLILEAERVEQVAGLIGELQQQLQVRSIGFGVSRERRRDAEDGLIAEALAAYRARAALIQQSLEARGWQIVQISIQTHGAPPVPTPRMEMRAMAADVAPPALEAGTSTVQVGVTGTIQLE